MLQFDLAVQCMSKKEKNLCYLFNIDLISLITLILKGYIMFDKIEKSLQDRIGTSVFVALFISFLFTVIFQSYVSDYKYSFFGFAIGLMLVSLGLFITMKLKDELEGNEKN